jgi:serine/threonine protein kinase
LHGKRVAHCDIKPANIIIRSTSSPTLIDLGSARFFDEAILPNHVVVSRSYSHQALV